MRVKPSRKFLSLIEHVYGSVSGTADGMGVDSTQLYRFVRGQGVSLAVLMHLSERLGLPIDDLIVVEPAPSKRAVKQPA